VTVFGEMGLLAATRGIDGAPAGIKPGRRSTTTRKLRS
jgi:hypothetical protein